MSLITINQQHGLSGIKGALVCAAGPYAGIVFHLATLFTNNIISEYLNHSGSFKETFFRGISKPIFNDEQHLNNAGAELFTRTLCSNLTIH